MLNEILTGMRQEWTLILILFLLLFIKVGGKERSNTTVLWIVNGLLLLNVLAGFICGGDVHLFHDMYRSNALICTEKTILNVGTLLISLQAFEWLKTHRHAIEFYMLLVSTLLGMFFMISSGNLLMFYLGLELSTIPLAAMANFDLDKRQSSEAAMKYIISSAFSSGLLLFGISMLYGASGTLTYSQLQHQLDAGNALQIFSFVMIMAGFAFKISAVPFHFWTADVYEGAPVTVTSYLSVISKGAVLFVFVSVLYTVFAPLANAWYAMLFLLSVLTIFIGNLFALRQQNMKRFLAFSSIAQVGFILVGLTAGNQIGSASVIYFVLVYIFSNLGAFGVISAVSALTGREQVSDFKGFYKTNPMLTWVLTIALFSLAGVPPTAGFFGKFFLLISGASKGNYALLAFAALNMIISFYYYLRIVKAMFMESNDTPVPTLDVALLPKLSMWLCLGGIVACGVVYWFYESIFAVSFGM